MNKKNNLIGGDSSSVTINSRGIFYSGEKRLDSVKHTEDGKIEVISIIRNNFGVWPESANSYKDQAIKEIYAAKDGKIVLEQEIKGTVIPPEKTPERIEWDS